MRTLSASEAIGPAWERTKEMLFEPFEWRRFAKLAACALLAEAGSLLAFPSSGGHFGGAHDSHGVAAIALVALAAVSIAMGLVFLLVGLVLFYFGSRMQLVMVEVIAKRSTLIRPLWAKHRQATWRWIGLKLILSVVLLALMAAAGVWFGVRMHHMALATVPGHLPPGFFAHFAVFFAVVFVVAMFISMLYWLLRDFVAPVIALEDASLGTAMRRLTALLEDEPGAVFLFVVVKCLLSVAAFVVIETVTMLATLVSLMPLGIVGGVLWIALHRAGLVGMIVLAVAAVVGVALLLSWMLMVLFALGGTISLFYQVFGLYFYGGRYPLLGDLLEPPVIPPVFLTEPPPTTAPDGVW